MTKKPENKRPKLPFAAKTMGSHQGEIARSHTRKDAKKASAHTSSVTIIRPDADGNLVEIETVAPVVAPEKSTAKKKRTKPPKKYRSIL